MEELETKCPTCGGSGGSPNDHLKAENCSQCYGEGEVPTYQGAKLLLFVAKYLGGYDGISERYSGSYIVLPECLTKKEG